MQCSANTTIRSIYRLITISLLLAALGLSFACQPSSPNDGITATEAAGAPTSASNLAEPVTAAIQSTAQPRQLSLVNKAWFGDFEAMANRRAIRVLVPYSRTLFFNDKGRERGITAELLRDFERFINTKLSSQLNERPITVYLIPTTRDRLFQELLAGHGDIAAGNLTVTQKRLKLVDFVSPRNQPLVRELLVTGPLSPKIQSLDDLAGKQVHIRLSSSYSESLSILNRRLLKAGKPMIEIVPLPEALEDEDALEMLNAGLLKFTVVDDWKVRIWAQVLPNIQVREDLVLRDKGHIGWAIRKQSPQLRAIIEDSYQNFAKKQGIIDYRLVYYHKNIRQISNINEGAKWQHFEQVIALFTKYGSKYDFDPLLLTAQGYQESELRQDARSEAGAIGIMQIMPATGKELNVGDIRILEPNIHGGAKYMDQLMTRYFKDAKFNEQNRTLFAFASYNAGPGNITKMRREAAQRGLDPDRWFNNVEIVTADQIGIETTTYVRNIFKYYVAYKLILQAEEEQRLARAKVERANRASHKKK